MFNNKKFVPPLLRKPTAAPDGEPPAKRSRVEYPTASQPAGARTLKIAATRKPLLLVRSSTAATEPSSAPPTASSTEGYYNVLWRKKTAKKHKTFDGDGVLAVTAGYAVLQDTSGKDLGRTMMKTLPEIGDLISISGKDVEINSLLLKADYLAGRPFLRAAAAVVETPAAGFQAVSATGFFGAKAFKTPLLGSTVLVNTHGKEPTPRHDPTVEGALVMMRPLAVPAGKKIVDVVVDPYLTQHLRPHQREGVKFLYEAVMGMKQFDGQGAILADEMGLGKTLQTIALLWTLLKQNPVHGEQPVVKKALIVCPVTLINNWRKEFKKWLGKERIGVFVADSKANLRDFTHGKIYSMMIIGYEKLQKVQAELKKTHIDIVIADEGHRLKTEKNKSAQAIRGLNTKRRVILSGTPLQNDLHEFYIMVDFVNPGLLESYNTFRKEFENPIVKSRQPGVTPKDVEKGKARGAELARLTKMFVLRRTAEILAAYLPPKTEYVVFCRPSPKQVKVYKAILDNPAFEGAYRSPDTSLLLITMLKKLCNSPGLLADKPGKETNETIKTLLSTVNPKLLESRSGSHSGKFRVLDRMLITLFKTTDEKIVIVSNYTSTLDLLQTLLSSRGLSFLRLDGKTPSSRRQELVDKFNRTDNKAAFAFLLSAKSGGAGINLIGASRLVLFDLDWNPATDAQAMARIHRDGQKKQVKIYRMLTTGCFDEKIYQRQLTKTGLADSVMDQKSTMGSFTMDELRDLFTLDTETDCQTHDLLACACEGKGYLADALGPGDEKGSGEDDEEGEEASEVVYPGLMKASEVDVEKIEKDRMAALKKTPKGAQLSSLMEYSHVLARSLVKEKQAGVVEDEEEFDEISIEDELLTKVVRDGEGKEVSFIFQKTF